jgi:hypothetical protein
MHAPLAVFAGAATARDGVEDLDLFAVLFDQAPDADPAVVAGVGRLFGGWVGFGCGRVLCAAHGA